MANIKLSSALITKTLILAAIAVAVIIGIIQLLDGGPTQTISATADAVAVHPSTGKAANLALNFWTVCGIIIGALLFGFSLACKLEDQYLSDNEKASNTTTTIGALLGLLLILACYLGPSYDVQRFTHITVPKAQAETIKNKDFKEKYAIDPNIELYNNSFRNQ